MLRLELGLGYWLPAKSSVKYLQVVKIKKVMEEMVEPTSIHTFDIAVLVTPGK